MPIEFVQVVRLLKNGNDWKCGKQRIPAQKQESEHAAKISGFEGFFCLLVVGFFLILQIFKAAEKNQIDRKGMSGTTLMSGIHCKIGQPNTHQLLHYLFSWCNCSL